MDKLKDSFFQSYFNMRVPRLIVKTETADYAVIAVNHSYEQTTGIKCEHVLDRSVFNFFSVEKTGAHGQALLQKALSEAIHLNEQIQLEEFEINSLANDSNQKNWWQIEILPVSATGKKPQYLVITFKDVTSFVLVQKELAEARSREQQLHEELAATNEELHASNEELQVSATELKQSWENLHELNHQLEARVLKRTADMLKTQQQLTEQHTLLQTIVNEVPAGICILTGPEMKLEMINSKLLKRWNRNYDIIGKPLLDIMPEIRDQDFPRLLQQVYITGLAYSEFDAPLELLTDGIKQTVYRDFAYTPIKDADGTTHSILALSMDVTERTLGRLREQHLLEEQSAVNEELSASNEELAATNEELHEAREDQYKLIFTLAESEARFRNMIMDAPVAICVLKGTDYIVDAINDEGLRILGKTPAIIGRSLKDILSAQEKRPFLDLVIATYRSGKIYHGNEVAAQFENNSILQEDYFNLVFKPTISAQDRSVEGIIIIASKVTDLVNERKERENAETKLGLAIEAAKMGSWHIDGKTKKLHYNPALAALFGYEGTEPMTYDQAIAQVTEDCREKLILEMDQAIAKGGAYDMTYTQRRFDDGEIIWLRSLGKINKDELGKYNIFSGVVMDITEQKEDEQRKNDFIGMVSHELKTPLTSLKGYTQILHAKAKKNEDNFAINALNKVNDQVSKMTAMINGFLNLSRLESGKIHLKKTTFNIDELVKENTEEAQMLTNTHEIIFHPCAPVPVFADRDKIGSVISNMISNAVKYSPQGKEIEITCVVVGTEVEISVKDQGIGISEEDVPRLFDRFYRVESNQTELISGFGIGLYLSAEIVLHHQGRIWVESKLGEGSTFFFRLPVTG